MSLRLLIDEDSMALPLVNLLRKVGHDLVTVNEADLMSQPDTVVFNSARANDRIVLTRNYRDFEALHLINPNHPGIFVIYRDAIVNKRISRKEIVRAIANLEAAQIPLANQFIVLNYWNY